MSKLGKKQFTREERMKYVTNNFNLPFEIVIELLHNETNHDASVDLSASSMAKTVKQTIFALRYPELTFSYDLMDTMNLAAQLGNARHMWSESAWKDPLTRKYALEFCGVDPKLIDKVVINPEGNTEGLIPVYIEQTLEPKIVHGVSVGGTPDLIFNGVVEDYKTVSPWTTMYPLTIQGYVMQMSTYRWIDPVRITSPQGKLLLKYPKWDANDAKRSSNYPKLPTEARTYDLYPVEVVDDFVSKKIQMVLDSIDLPDDNLPPCPSERLDIKRTWKIYSNMEAYMEGKPSRRTCETLDDALIAMRSIKKGILLEITGKPSACGICPFTSVCNQFALINKESMRILKEW